MTPFSNTSSEQRKWKQGKNGKSWAVSTSPRGMDPPSCGQTMYLKRTHFVTQLLQFKKNTTTIVIQQKKCKIQQKGNLPSHKHLQTGQWLAITLFDDLFVSATTN